MLLADRCRQIEMLVLDVDGVLTDGNITYTDAGAELKAFHVRDGSGIKLWLASGKKACLLTGRSSAVVTRRAAELGLSAVQGAADKLAAFRALLARESVSAEATAYAGDDLPDLPVLAACGLALAPADACPEARELAHYVTRVPGGRGAVREVIEWLLRAQGRWQAAIVARGT